MIWEGVAAGILLALLTGLTTLAYKHPKGYARVHEMFWRVLFVAFGIYSVFIFGVKFGVSTMWPFIDVGKFDQARAAGPDVWTFIYAWAIFIALVLYLGFLRYIPKLVGKDDDFVPEAGFVIPLVRRSTKNKPANTKKNHQRSPKRKEADHE